MRAKRCVCCYRGWLSAVVLSSLFGRALVTRAALFTAVLVRRRLGAGGADLLFAFQQRSQISKSLMGRFWPLWAGGRAFGEVLLVGVAGVFVVVAKQAQQLPVGAVLWIVVVVVVAVMHSQFAQALAGKLAAATATNVRVHLQGFVAVAVFARTLGFGDDAVGLEGCRGFFCAHVVTCSIAKSSAQV